MSAAQIKVQKPLHGWGALGYHLTVSKCNPEGTKFGVWQFDLKVRDQPHLDHCPFPYFELPPNQTTKISNGRRGKNGRGTRCDHLHDRQVLMKLLLIMAPLLMIPIGIIWSTPSISLVNLKRFGLNEKLAQEMKALQERQIFKFLAVRQDKTTGRETGRVYRAIQKIS